MANPVEPLRYGQLGAGGRVHVESDGVHVTDEAGTDRVQMGRLPSGDYGLQVVNAGATVIIDGSSNMFKVAATGTMSHTQGASSDGSTSTDLTGLGTLSTTPAHLSFASEGNTAGSHQHLSRFAEITETYVAGASGGSPTQEARTINWQANMVTMLAAGICRVILGVSNAAAVSKTAFARYYVLQEAAL